MAKKEVTLKSIKPELIIGAGVLIVIVALGIGYLISSNRENPSYTGQGTSTFDQTMSTFNQPTCKQVPYQEQECKQVPFTTQEPYNDQECQNVPYTDQECEQKDLVYSLDRGVCRAYCTETVEVCTHYNFLGWCDAKESRCVKAVAGYSVDVTNLDTEGGTWTYTGSFNTNGEPFDGGTKSNYLYPQNKKTFQFYYSWSGTESNPVDPNDVESCSYKTIRIPTKTLCRDVIKLKEECHTVTKYRTVTDYREECTYVTKYKQECD